MKKNILFALGISIIWVIIFAVSFHYYKKDVYDGEITIASIDVDGNTVFKSGDKTLYNHGKLHDDGCYTPFSLQYYAGGYRNDEKSITPARACGIAHKAIKENYGAFWLEDRKPILYDFVESNVYIVNYVPVDPHVLTEIPVVVINTNTGTILFCGVI